MKKPKKGAAKRLTAALKKHAKRKPPKSLVRSLSTVTINSVKVKRVKGMQITIETNATIGPSKPTLCHKLGDKHFIEGVECAVGHINQGLAWLFPTFDDPDHSMIARHIAFARIDEYGIIKLYDHAIPVSDAA